MPGDFKLDGATSLPLDNGGAVADAAMKGDVADLEPHQIATPQLAIDGQIQHGRVSNALSEIEARPEVQI